MDPVRRYRDESSNSGTGHARPRMDKIAAPSSVRCQSTDAHEPARCCRILRPGRPLIAASSCPLQIILRLCTALGSRPKRSTAMSIFLTNDGSERDCQRLLREIGTFFSSYTSALFDAHMRYGHLLLPGHCETEHSLNLVYYSRGIKASSVTPSTS